MTLNYGIGKGLIKTNAFLPELRDRQGIQREAGGLQQQKTTPGALQHAFGLCMYCNFHKFPKCYSQAQTTLPSSSLLLKLFPFTS